MLWWLHRYTLIFAFFLLKFLICLLHRIEIEGILVFLIAADWSRRTWYYDLVKLLEDALCALPDCSHVLSPGPTFHLSSVTAYNSMVVEAQSLSLHVECIQYVTRCGSLGLHLRRFAMGQILSIPHLDLDQLVLIFCLGPLNRVSPM